jgi:hypothetical protein
MLKVRQGGWHAEILVLEASGDPPPSLRDARRKGMGARNESTAKLRLTVPPAVTHKG